MKAKGNAMTKFEHAVHEAEKLPDEIREQLGDDLLHYVHKLLALRDDLAIGLKQLDKGDTIDGDTVFNELKSRYGA